MTIRADLIPGIVADPGALFLLALGKSDVGGIFGTDDVKLIGDITADGELFLMATGPMQQIARVQAVIPLLTATWAEDPRGCLTTALTWPTVMQLAMTYGRIWTPGPALSEWVADQITRRTGALNRPLDYLPPAPIVPYWWQIQGAQMIRSHGVFLMDSPGTGKSGSTILGLANRALDQPVLPILVICPKSVVDPWLEEFERWAPHWKAIAWRGSPSARKRLLGTADVYVCSYELAARDAGPNVDAEKSPILPVMPICLVCDESHGIKNPAAIRTLAVKRIARTGGRNGTGVDVFMPLTGTPIAHNSKDLWPTFDLMEPGAFPSADRNNRRYVLETTGHLGQGRVIGLNPHARPEFDACLLGRTRRVITEDVLADLPEKIYTVRYVDVPQPWRKAYDTMESQMLAELPDGEELPVFDTRVQLTRLSQMASAACDVTVTQEWSEKLLEWRDHYHVEMMAPSWKIDELLEIMEERPGKQFICFTPSRQLALLAGKAAEAAGYRTAYIVGEQKDSERTAYRLGFQAGDYDIICATTGAGSVGLTLTAGGVEVFLQRPWSLIQSYQAEGRSGGRIGSDGFGHKFIEIIDVCASNTVESRVRAALKDKGGQMADFLKDPRIVAGLLGGDNVKKIRKGKG